MYDKSLMQPFRSATLQIGKCNTNKEYLGLIMKKRNCKFKYKLIMLLLILSILLGEFAIRPMSVKAVDALTYTYWDLWYSISGAQHASMSAKEGPFDGYDAAELKDRAKVQFDNFKIWLQRAYVPVGITVDMLVNQADEMIENAKTTGLEMSQELWDAFRQYFDDVSNKKTISESYARSVDDLNSLIKSITSVDLNLKSNSTTQRFLDSDHMCIAKVEWDGGYQYRVVIPQEGCSFTGWGYYDYDSYKYITHCNNYKHMYWGWIIYSDGSISCQNINLYFNPTRENITPLVLDWTADVGTISDVYSPFIDYSVTDACPQEVPESIPWRVYPKEETDDDTKIIPFPVEVPDEGTTEVPGEETTEKPNPDEDPDNDNDEENDPFPGIFPWFPNVPNSNPDENPDIPPWENPDSDSDPDSGLSPDPDPNPEPDPAPPDPEPEPDPPGKVENYLNKLKTKFPFCIPFDMVALFKNLKKTQKAPKWTFSYTFHFGDKPYTWKIVVDMADYDQYIQIFREGFFVLFLVGLFFATRKLISWQID